MIRIASDIRHRSSSTGEGSVVTPRAAAEARLLGTKQLFGSVPLRKRIAAIVENTRVGVVIDVVSATLSMLTVFTYMAETYYDASSPTNVALRAVDLACSCIFAAEWCFWLWLAQDKLKYVCSVQSGVDAVTIVPMFLALFITAAGFHAFQSMIRFARVLRVYRIFRLGKRVQNEVAGRLMSLVFSLLAILLTGAAFFYEIETRYASAYPDLTFERSLYWSVVTVTTIGYGDLSPSVAASQMMLLGMLAITFTLLPYQTSELVNAFQHSSVYQRAAYRQSRNSRHIVICGSFGADSAQQVVEELYHADYGFQDCTTVFLSSQPPDESMRLLLKTHRLSGHLLYVQGHPMLHKDLQRVQVQLADAVFILCSKPALDAHQEDTGNIMALLSIGHFMHACQRQRAHPKVLPMHKQWQLSARHLLHPQQKDSGRQPHIFLQLTLPQSRDKLLTTLDALTDDPCSQAVAADLPDKHG